jgi:hypothetical protein
MIDRGTNVGTELLLIFNNEYFKKKRDPKS